MSNTGPDLSTSQAADYASGLGKPTSRSYLQKCRIRGPDDPRDHGPDFWRGEDGRCWYQKDAIDAWVFAWKQQRKFRASAQRPTSFAA